MFQDVALDVAIATKENIITPSNSKQAIQSQSKDFDIVDIDSAAQKPLYRLE